MGIEAAIIGGAALGAGASVYSGNRSASAIKSAQNQASTTELQMYNQSRADLAPFRERGYQALDMIAGLYGLPARQQAPGSATGVPANFAQWLRGQGASGLPGAGSAGPAAMSPTPGSAPRDLSAFYASPDYEFRRTEGLRDINNSYAARGGAASGPAMRGAIQYSGDLASGEFNNYVNRLFSIAGLGGNATSQGVNAASNTAGNLSNIYVNSGNARASAYGNMAAGVNSSIQGGLGNWVLMDYLGAKGGGYGGGGYMGRTS